MSNRPQRALFAALVFIALASAGTVRAVAAGSGYAKRPDVREFVHDFSAESGIPKGVLLKLFAQVEAQPSVLRLMTTPYATPPKWFEYAPQFLSEARTNAGVAFLNANRAALARAEAQYGVPPEIVVAIIGVETFYGRIVGRYRVVDALTTLAFDYPRRADFFRDELKQFLLLTREWKIPPLKALGSFAGAMGLPQFMPSSFRRFAVDFDNDGRIDIWSDNDDVIGSVAHYLQRHGWERGGPVSVVADVEPAVASTLVGDSGLSAMREYGEWVVQNVTARGMEARIDPRAAAMLYQLDESDGPQFRLGFANFAALRHYNRSRLYATAVFELAERIRKAQASAPVVPAEAGTQRR